MTTKALIFAGKQKEQTTSVEKIAVAFRPANFYSRSAN